MKKLLIAIMLMLCAGGSAIAAQAAPAVLPPGPPAPNPAANTAAKASPKVEPKAEAEDDVDDDDEIEPKTESKAKPKSKAKSKDESKDKSKDASLSDSRIRELKYSDQDVYTITTKYGYQSNIVFGKGEEIQTISVGDRSLWQLIPAGNRLFIRPMEYGMQTNMTLLTNKHSYQFDLKSVANEKAGGNIYVARFIYPEDEAKKAEKNASLPPPFVLAEATLNHPATPTPTPAPAPAHAEPAPLLNTSALQSSPAPAPTSSISASTAASPINPNYNYNYTYAGPDALAPLKAYDDGKSTFIEYGQNQPLPSIYMIDAGGKPQSVSYTIQNNSVIVINAVAGEWRLEDNSGNVHLYNETMNPG